MPLGKGDARPNNGDYEAMGDGSGHGEVLGRSPPQYLVGEPSAEPQRHAAGKSIMDNG